MLCRVLWLVVVGVRGGRERVEQRMWAEEEDEEKERERETWRRRDWGGDDRRRGQEVQRPCERGG